MTQPVSSIIHPPVNAIGLEIRNSFGVTIARATDPTIAAALVYLINSGHVLAKDLAMADAREEVPSALMEARYRRQVGRLANEGFGVDQILSSVGHKDRAAVERWAVKAVRAARARRGKGGA